MKRYVSAGFPELGGFSPPSWQRAWNALSPVASASLQTRWTLLLRGCLLALWMGGIFAATPGWAQWREQSDDELLASLSHSDVDQRRDAAYELVRRGANSEPVVLGLAKAVSDKDIQVRFQALLGLARAGDKSELAVDALLKCLDDDDDQIRYRAADALGKIGASSVDGLVALWKDGSSDAKVAAAQAFAIIGPPAESAITSLEAGLGDRSEAVRRHAAWALIAIARADESRLLRLARHEDGTVRTAGVAALVALPAPSEVVTELLKSAVSDDEAKVREQAVIALAKSHLSLEDKASAVESSLLDDVDAVRQAAVVAAQKAQLLNSAFAERIAQHLGRVEAGPTNAIVKTLHRIGADAQGTLPALLTLADQTHVDQELLAETIGRFEPSVVAKLLVALKTQPQIEPLVSRALSGLGQAAIDFLPEGLQDPSEIVRVAATKALGNIRPTNRSLLEPLVTVLQDQSHRVRSLAVKALITAAEEADFAKEAVLHASQDAHPEVRAAALPALSIFDYADDQRRLAFDAGFSDSAPSVRVAALLVASDAQETLQANLDRIVDLTGDDTAQVRVAALKTLADLPRDSIHKNGKSALVDALADDAAPIRVAATRTITQLELTDSELLPMLGENLSAGQEDLELLEATLEALAGFGKEADELIPAVSPWLEHSVPRIRVTAIDSLAAISQDPNQLAERLATALDDSEYEVRRVAAAALGELGPDARQAVPKLFRMLRVDEDSDFASGALREIDAAPTEAIPLLVENLDSRDRRTGYYAVFLLGKIGPAAAEALPKLEAMLEDNKDSEFRVRFLRQAIESIQDDETSDE